MSTESIEIAKRWFREVWSEGRASTIEELMHPSATGHTHQGTIESREEWKARVWDVFQSGFSNITLEVEDAIARGDTVAVRWRATMDHTGEGLGVPASNKSLEFPGMTWMVIENGQIVRGWDSWDSTALLVECGAWESVSAQGDPSADRR